jgi:hypothetical protein
VQNRGKCKKRPAVPSEGGGGEVMMVFSTRWLEFKDMAQDPLVSREPVSASCNRRPDEVLETQTYSLCTKEHPANTLFPLKGGGEVMFFF